MATGKRKVSAKGCRAKGANAETELTAILNELGLPSVRVLGSGKFAKAKSDVKFGVNDASQTDEQTSAGRLEVKNRADNPDHLFDTLLAVSDKGATELAFQHQHQDDVSIGVAYRRSRVKPGDLKNKNWNDVWLISFPLEFAVELLKLYADKQKETK